MYGLTIYKGTYYHNSKFLELLFGHKHKKAVRISIDFKKEEINKIKFYSSRTKAGLDILDKVLFQWNLKLSSKVDKHVRTIKKSL